MSTADPDKGFLAGVITRILPFFLLLLSLQISRAGSATWSSAPVSGDWNVVLNWTPAVIPNGLSDKATFDSSTITNVLLSADTLVDGIVFNANASAFTIAASPTFTLTISGTGITLNNLLVAQNFVTAIDGLGHHGEIQFTNGATAASAIFTNNGSVVDSTIGGLTKFLDNATAGNGMFINNPAGVGGAASGHTQFFNSTSADHGRFINNGGMVAAGVTEFHDVSSAADGIFTSNSGTAHNAGGGSVEFYDNSTAGQGVFTIDSAVVSGSEGIVEFTNSSTAANGTFTTNGGVINGGYGGFVGFGGDSTAANGVFTNKGGTVSGSFGGQVLFVDASAGNGTFYNEGGTVNNAGGGITEFYDTSSADDATLIANGGTVSGALGGIVRFWDTSTADDATLIANGGTNGGLGGSIKFNSGGSTARAKAFGNGTIDFDYIGAFLPTYTVGSIEGDGIAFLGECTLTVGSNNLSTSFSGVIQGGGAYGGGKLIKTGTGTLTISGSNPYIGGTEVQEGRLIVNNTSGSGTGNGTVIVDNGATLGGSGTIALNSGAYLINNGIIAPGDSVGQFNISGDIQLGYSSNLSFEIGGATAAAQYDVLNKSNPLHSSRH